MKNIILSFAFLSAFTINAQRITNVVLVGSQGITDDIKKAESFIVVKQFNDYFERLDYKASGPLIKSRSYKDSSLTILQGNYYEYRPDGTILLSGKNKDNKKCEDWMTFDETGNVIKFEKYENDLLIETKNLNEKDSSKEFPDQRQAEFPGGINVWIRYLVKSLDKSDATSKSPKGGTVIINFMIDLSGEVQEAYITKSVDFFLDEDSIGIIRNSPKWNSAWENGHPKKAYRRQPITYPSSE